MNGLVLDASVTLAWCFDDEASPYADAVLRTLMNLKAHAPTLWALEVVNVLALAKRRKRMPRARFDANIEFLTNLDVRLETTPSGVAFGEVLELAETHQIASYDAAYLELARRLRLPLATLDADLRRVAPAAGVAILLNGVGP